VVFRGEGVDYNRSDSLKFQKNEVCLVYGEQFR
jgi:hypothetical protein